MEKVLKDENLKQYRGKFPNKPKEPITRSYNCHTFIQPDTTAVDSSGLDVEESVEVTPIENIVE